MSSSALSRTETRRAFWLRRPGPIEWLYLVVGLGLIYAYRWLMDDAFIYFRYVDNFLFLDSGLTYNRGEFVEGFTSPAHCLLLIALRSMEWSYPAISLGIGLVSFTIFWYVLVVVNRALSPPGSSRALNVPLAYLSANYAVASYFTSGLEAPLALLWGALYAALFVRPSSTGLALAVAISPLVRPELAVAVALALAYCWWRNRRFPLALFLTALIANGSWLTFRIWYYADLVPSTFHLKDMMSWRDGLAFIRDFDASYHVALYLATFLALAVFLARRASPIRIGPRIAMLAVALPLAAYVVRIGGGAIHGYYLWVPFILVVAATAGLAEWLSEELRIRRRPVLEALAMVLVVAVVATRHSPTLARHPILITTRENRAGKIADPVHHRVVPTLGTRHWSEKTAPDRQREFAGELARRGYRDIRATGYCQTAYLNFSSRWVHSFGLTDGFLARVDAPERRKGHKPVLKPMSQDIATVQAGATSIGRGMFHEAIEAGRAPEWVVENRAVLDAIERRVYNRHDWAENARLALSDPGTIDPGNLYEEWRAQKKAERERASPARLKRGNSR